MSHFVSCSRSLLRTSPRLALAGQHHQPRIVHNFSRRALSSATTSSNHQAGKCNLVAFMGMTAIAIDYNNNRATARAVSIGDLSFDNGLSPH